VSNPMLELSFSNEAVVKEIETLLGVDLSGADMQGGKSPSLPGRIGGVYLYVSSPLPDYGTFENVYRVKVNLDCIRAWNEVRLVLALHLVEWLSETSKPICLATLDTGDVVFHYSEAQGLAAASKYQDLLQNLHVFIHRKQYQSFAPV
jgi:hypothetical protein